MSRLFLASQDFGNHAAHLAYVILSDEDIFVVNGDRSEVLR